MSLYWYECGIDILAYMDVGMVNRGDMNLLGIIGDLFGLLGLIL